MSSLSYQRVVTFFNNALFRALQLFIVLGHAQENAHFYDHFLATMMQLVAKLSLVQVNCLYRKTVSLIFVPLSLDYQLYASICLSVRLALNHISALYCPMFSPPFYCHFIIHRFPLTYYLLLLVQ